MIWKDPRVVFFAALATIACSATQPPSSSGGTARPVGDRRSDAPPPASTLPGAPAASVTASPVLPAPESPQARQFPPPDVTPPHARSAGDRDGHWTPYYAGSGEPVDLLPPPTFAVTRIHPHEVSRFVEVTIVAIDLAKASLEFMPGTEDLGGVRVPFAAGLVPVPQRDRLLAVFNGGFQPRHGRWGMKLGETTVVPARDQGCTLALYADGSVRLRSWTALASPAGVELRAFRQTPPCLLEEGAVHPDLLAGRDKAWKGQTPGIVTRRRSAIGLDQSGTLLFYALGVEAPPRLLAEALRVVGAQNAAELDINWNWTRFLLYDRDADGKPRVATSLAPGEYAKSTYVERASERDFFYVLQR
jgi:hypothetical protein